MSVRQPRPEHADTGSASVEFILASLGALVMTLAVLQFALTEHARHLAQHVADAALAAARAEDGTAHDGRQAAEDALHRVGGTLRDPKVVVRRGQRLVQVRVSGHVSLLLPLRVTATAAGPAEVFTTPTGQAPR